MKVKRDLIGLGITPTTTTFSIPQEKSSNLIETLRIEDIMQRQIYLGRFSQNTQTRSSSNNNNANNSINSSASIYTNTSSLASWLNINNNNNSTYYNSEVPVCKIYYPKYDNIISSFEIPAVSRKFLFIPFFKQVTFHDELENDKIRCFTYKFKELKRFVVKVIDMMGNANAANSNTHHNYDNLA